MKKLELEKLEKEYIANSDGALKLSTELTKQLDELVKSEEIQLAFPIQSRVKSWDSIRGKIDRNSLTLTNILELQDLVGHRIILVFKRDVERVINLISTHLKTIRKYDTHSRLNEDQFGYSSYHVVASVPESWLNVPTLKHFDNLKTEIQIRTLSQHLWAEVSHKLQYKNESSVPKSILRSVYRTSALLELIDLEFERVLVERDNYREEIENSTESTQDKRLNVDLLEQVLDSKLPPLNKGDDEELDDLLQDLISMEIDTAGKLIDLINRQLNQALSDEKKRVASETKNIKEDMYIELNSWVDLERLKKGCFYQHVGIVRIMLDHEFGKKWKKYQENSIFK